MHRVSLWRLPPRQNTVHCRPRGYAPAERDLHRNLVAGRIFCNVFDANFEGAYVDDRATCNKDGEDMLRTPEGDAKMAHERKHKYLRSVRHMNDEK